MEIQNKVRSMLKDFVSDGQVSDLYASLLLHGPQTISELARTSKVERTRIYRSLHELQALQLVEIELEPHRQIIHPASIANLQNTVAARQSALDLLKESIAEFQAEYIQDAHAGVATKVQFYKGIEGIEQMLWNQTRAQGEMLSILSENIQSHSSKAFFERWVARCNERELKSRSLVDDHFIAAQKKWYGGKMGHAMKHWEARKLPEDISSVPHRTTVYDNVTLYFSWQDNDPFGIEIYNQNIADNQRQYFELLWTKSATLE